MLSISTTFSLFKQIDRDGLETGKDRGGSSGQNYGSDKGSEVEVEVISVRILKTGNKRRGVTRPIEPGKYI